MFNYLYDPFSRFLKMTYKHAQKHHIKKSEKFIRLKNLQVRKTAKMAKKGPKMAVFWPWRSEF